MHDRQMRMIMENRGCISRLCSAGNHIPRICDGFNLAQAALHSLGFTQVSTIPGMKSLSCYHILRHSILGISVGSWQLGLFCQESVTMTVYIPLEKLLAGVIY